MKKILNLFAAAAILFAAFSCNKELNPVAQTDSRVVEFSTVPLTKTVFGEKSGTSYPTLWTENQLVALSLNYGTAVKSSEPISTDGGATARFTAELTDDASGNYRIAALSPYKALPSSGSFNKSDKYVRFDIKEDQTPLDASVDETVQVLVACYDAGTTFPSSVTLNFSHVTAYSRMSLANLSLANGESVDHISLTSTLDWAGRFDYYLEDSGNRHAGDIKVQAGEKTITLNTQKTTDIWFACAPVEIGGTSVEVVVTTNKGTSYTKSVSFPAGKQFQSGHVAKFTVDMTGSQVSGATAYTLVTDVASLTLGSECIFVNDQAGKAAVAMGSNSYLSASSISISGSTAYVPTSATSVEVFKAADGFVKGTYAFLCSSDGGKYLAYKDKTEMEKRTSCEKYGSWSVTVSNKGDATIRNMWDPDRYLLFNSSSDRFTTYVPGNSYSSVRIYKKAGTGSGTITPKEPDHLVISKATTSFSKGDAFVFDGTVTLVYSDLSEEVLTSGYTVDDSQVNMNAAGTYPVVVVYGGDPVNVNGSYDITVYGSSAYTWTLKSGDLTESGGYATSVTNKGGTVAKTWTIGYVWQQSGPNAKPNWDADKGVQIGTASNPVSTVTFTSTGFSSWPVTRVRVNASQAASGSGSISVSVGGTAYTYTNTNTNTSNAPLSESATDFIFTGNSTGEVVITISETKEKAVYLKAIGVNEE